MDRPAKRMDRVTMQNATHFSARGVEKAIERAREVETDPRKDERLAKSLCIGCFYSGGRIGGAAMTTQPCMCCGKEQIYTSTSTDALCLPCAQKHSLCKRCGGDLDMRVDRPEWPEPDADGGKPATNERAAR